MSSPERAVSSRERAGLQPPGQYPAHLPQARHLFVWRGSGSSSSNDFHQRPFSTVQPEHSLQKPCALHQLSFSPQISQGCPTSFPRSKAYSSSSPSRKRLGRLAMLWHMDYELWVVGAMKILETSSSRQSSPLYINPPNTYGFGLQKLARRRTRHSWP